MIYKLRTEELVHRLVDKFITRIAYAVGCGNNV